LSFDIYRKPQSAEWLSADLITGVTFRKDLPYLVESLRTRRTFASSCLSWTHFPSTNRKVKLTANFSEMLGLGMRQAPSVSTERFRGMKFKQETILLSNVACRVLVIPISDNSERLF
jgi:hypothetical protein